jgi:hypothetical protein
VNRVFKVHAGERGVTYHGTGEAFAGLIDGVRRAHDAEASRSDFAALGAAARESVNHRRMRDSHRRRPDCSARARRLEGRPGSPGYSFDQLALAGSYHRN